MRHYSWSQRHKPLASAVEELMAGWRAMEPDCRVHRSAQGMIALCVQRTGNIKRLNFTNTGGQDIHFGSAINH